MRTKRPSTLSNDKVEPSIAGSNVTRSMAYSAEFPFQLRNWNGLTVC